MRILHRALTSSLLTDLEVKLCYIYIYIRERDFFDASIESLALETVINVISVMHTLTEELTDPLGHVGRLNLDLWKCLISQQEPGAPEIIEKARDMEEQIVSAMGAGYKLIKTNTPVIG